MLPNSHFRAPKRIKRHRKATQTNLPANMDDWSAADFRRAFPTLSVDEVKDVDLSLFGEGQQGSVAVVSESGLRKLTAYAEPVRAREFLHWLDHEALPAIKKKQANEAGHCPKPGASMPTTYPEALRYAADAVERREQAERDLQALRSQWQ